MYSKREENEKKKREQEQKTKGKPEVRPKNICSYVGPSERPNGGTM
jgi:hypothetical protein